MRKIEVLEVFRMGDRVFRYDIEGLAEELGTDIQSICALFTSYMEEMAGEVRSMREFLKKSDWRMLQRVVHNIKGVSANLRIMDVFSGAEKIDLLLKSGQIQDLDEKIESLIRSICSAENEIRKYFNQNGFLI